MPGSTPPTSQLDWLGSTTAMIVLSWSRPTRDLLKSFGWGIAALHRLEQRRSCHLLAARPIGSSQSAILPRRLHRAATDRRHRSLQQGTHLRYPPLGVLPSNIKRCSARLRPPPLIGSPNASASISPKLHSQNEAHQWLRRDGSAV